ncbi:amidohydrolase family protein [Plantactinospora sp. KBS50]|uniref:amidohydrolase family protein n=1 Tax=Plantactinospora sp. KBS50 TaxID=2024580 RepID=UPI000BAAAC60|nr:amidohydrolase family protein [Plantactinospora sp. KBS50]ASW58087.1 amidohydrolase [Plantactinospora sp. KBS50]
MTTDRIHLSDRPRLTAVRADRIFDGTSILSLVRPALLIDGGTVAAVVDADELPPGADVVDLGGTTLLPGLIDTHVHLAFDAGPDPLGSLAARDHDAALDAMTTAARIAAAGGVTTVRDLGALGYLALTLRERPGGDEMPTILAAGPPMTSPGGHCADLGGAVRGIPAVIEAVRAHAERGVDVIKVMAGGGYLTPGSDPTRAQFSAGELGAIVTEAHRHGLPVTAHAHGPAEIALAADSGVDGIEHASFLTPDGPHATDELIGVLARRRIIIGATIGVRPIPGMTPPPHIARHLPALRDNLRRLHEAGAPIVAGTDAGIGPIKPHDVARYAVADLVGMGMSPTVALSTVTVRAAEVCGLAHRKGRLAAGFDADVLAVDGNPLEDLGALHRIRAVFLRGRRLNPAHQPERITP